MCYSDMPLLTYSKDLLLEAIKAPNILFPLTIIILHTLQSCYDNRTHALGAYWICAHPLQALFGLVFVTHSVLALIHHITIRNWNGPFRAAVKKTFFPVSEESRDLRRESL